jgi:hypothetical protein
MYYTNVKHRYITFVHSLHYIINGRYKARLGPYVLYKCET